MPAVIADALEATGLPYELEVGGCHFKIKLNGRLVGILSKSGASHAYGISRAHKNTVAQIRRAAREMGENA
jgi:hypothetical protein